MKPGPQPKYLSVSEKKAEVSARQNVKITCECGVIVSKCNLITHMKSKKHFQLIETGVWEGPNSQKLPESVRQQRVEERRAAGIIKLTCECGSIVSKYNLAGHLKSDKHLQLMEKGEWHPRGNTYNPKSKFQYHYGEEAYDRMRARARSKVTCECGCNVLYNSLWIHKRSSKHKRLMEKQEKEEEWFIIKVKKKRWKKLTEK